MRKSKVVVESLRPEDIPAVVKLLIDGLVERWGSYVAEFNPDIEVFPTAYGFANVYVARLDGQVVGTGTLKILSADQAEVVRMSVAALCRRTGVGVAILDRLLRSAREQGIREVVLETTTTWDSAVQLYTQYGFKKTHERGGDSYFSCVLTKR